LKLSETLLLALTVQSAEGAGRNSYSWWCSWLEPIGKRCISVMHMSSAGFYHNISAHFLQRNSLES